jgi:hypothetical protein
VTSVVFIEPLPILQAAMIVGTAAITTLPFMRQSRRGEAGEVRGELVLAVVDAPAGMFSLYGPAAKFSIYTTGEHQLTL